ncbi:hypothetical protein Syun_022552 [Stephania yunnanensis]|uniref:tRNA (guanine(26)-N(2))-dimethyltransferase n=1 Tax=Stephania yunnanensis TaxID=152371 RepID=A0AAP0F861_9MAGN
MGEAAMAQKSVKNSSSDPNDFKVIKEGEAEILMLANNEVFFNKTQVNNRDMSIAVLRTFISKRTAEHEAMMAKKMKRGQRLPLDERVEPAIEMEEATADGSEKSNGECIEPAKPPQDEPTNVSEESSTMREGKGRGEIKPLRVLEALAASGLRALRYAREVEGIGQVVALDNDKASVEACQRNIKFNGTIACEKVQSHLADARIFMLTHLKEFDVVDLDPYGSPSVFLDSAVQSVVDGGILMCTATDMAVLCGGNGEVCYSKYGSYPLRGKYCHEMALRILLASIESHANRYKRYIVPIISVQMDFYVRVFVRIYTSASEMKNTPLKLSYVYQCIGCDSFHLQALARTVSKNNSIRYMPGFAPAVPQECSHCGKKFNMGGPIWSAPIHDQEWVSSMLADVNSMKDRYPAYDRISAVLTTISEYRLFGIVVMFSCYAAIHGAITLLCGPLKLDAELPDVPLFLSLHNLCATLKCTSPSAVIFRSAVINAGYRISVTHVYPLGLKSDAPMDVIWDIMRCWVENHPVKAQPSDQPGSVILAKKSTLKANFARAVASLSKGQAKKVARFLPNPERHWGPKPRAGRQIKSKHASLLGPQAVNGCNSHEADEPDAKRHKVDEPATASE